MPFVLAVVLACAAVDDGGASVGDGGIVKHGVEHDGHDANNANDDANDDDAEDVVRAAPRARHRPSTPPPPAWVYGAAAAGTSLLGSVGGALGFALIVLPAGSAIALLALVAAAPASAGYLVSTLSDEDGIAPVVGVVVGDVLGVIGGAVAGFAIAAHLTRDVVEQSACEDFCLGPRSVAILGGTASGIALGRALGSGIGAALGSLVPPPPTPTVY